MSTRARRWSGRTVVSARAYWRARLLAAGSLPCWRCGRPLTVRSAWTVGHLRDRSAGGSVTDRSNQWPEHARCNYSAGGKVGAAITNARRPVVVAAREAAAERGIRGW